jgi:hypothetical protein
LEALVRKVVATGGDELLAWVHRLGDLVERPHEPVLPTERQEAFGRSHEEVGHDRLEQLLGLPGCKWMPCAVGGDDEGPVVAVVPLWWSYVRTDTDVPLAWARPVMVGTAGLDAAVQAYRSPDASYHTAG